MARERQPSHSIRHIGYGRSTAEMAASNRRQSDYYSLQVILIHTVYVLPCHDTGFCLYSNGVGRSGAFCGLFTLIEVTKMESVIDFFHKVKAMRTQRPGMVQTVVITNPFTFQFYLFM